MNISEHIRFFEQEMTRRNYSKSEQMRDSTIIYRSFYENIKKLPKKNRADVWEAIMEYSLNFKEVELKGIADIVFSLIKPQLEANIQRYKNGAKPKRNISEPEANDKQNGSETGANKSNNVNKNPNKNKKVNETIPVPDFFEFESYVISKMDYQEFEKIKIALKFKYESWVENGWKDGNDKKITKWKSKILNTIPYLKENGNTNSGNELKTIRQLRNEQNERDIIAFAKSGLNPIVKD